MPETNSVIATQRQHVSIRSFENQSVASDLLETILAAGRRAPTSSNLQAYSVIVIHDPQVKQQLATLAGGQKHIETCPVFLAFCADIHRLGAACELHDVDMKNNLETFLIATIDAALVGMSVQTAAESFGLGAVMIGSLRNDPQTVANLLALPSGVMASFGMCLGWPVKADIPPQKPRLPRDLVIHQEKYSTRDPGPLLKIYDQALREHYEALGRNRHDAAWSGPIAQRLTRLLRPDLVQAITEMGFDLS